MKNTLQKTIGLGAAVLAGTILVGAVLAQEVKSITGSGASFPFPLYSEMFKGYAEKTGVQVNYQSKGSGAGKSDIAARNVDFAGSDSPMSNDELSKAPGAILHIPMALGAVVPTYNLPGVSEKLKFTGALLADVYLGKIKTWNDAAIAKINPKIKLPNLPITAVYRSDGSGTTSIWVDYLAKASSEWAEKVSKGPVSSVKWPVGVGGPQNAGVAGLVKQIPGALGYVETVYAKANNLAYGLVRNKAGKWVDGGDLKEIALASDSKPLPADTRVSITDADIGYPIAGFTWILVYKDQKYGNRTSAQGKAMKDLLEWMLGDGQKFHEKLNYAQIDGSALTKARGLVAGINYGGKPL